MRPRDHLKHLFEACFLVWGPREGTVLPSGFCVQYGETPFPIRETRRVDFLLGGVCSYPRWIFEEFRFTDQYRSLGLGEDKDFSCAVSRAHPVYVTPHARLLHYESPKMRPDNRAWSRMFLCGTYMLFRKHAWRGWWSWGFFWYATTGYALARLAALCVFPNRGKRDKLLGLWDAVRAIAAGRVRLDADTPGP